MHKKSKAGRSLNQRIMTQLAVMMLLTALVVSLISYQALKSTYLRLFNEKAQDIVCTLSSEIDGDRLAFYVETGSTDEYYDHLKEEFDRFKAGFSNIQYLYLFYPESDHWIYIVEGFKEGDDPEDYSELGDVYKYGETEYKYLIADIEAGRASQDLIQGADVGYGQTISAWSPVFDSSGKMAGMVQADCILSNLNAVVRPHAIRIVGTLVLLMLLVLALAIWFLKRNVTEPIGKLTGMVDSYEHGTVSEETFRHNDEIQRLASSFTEMTGRINAYTEEVARATTDRERIRAEFSVAKQIQTDILPNVFPAFPERTEFDIMASIVPCREIGGDFYDFFLVDDDHLALVVGDVSDKGVPAALFMVIVKTLIKNRALQGFSPAEVLQNVSEQLLEGNKAGMFSTVWFAILELSTGKGIAANAGHEHPILSRNGTRFEQQEYQHSPPIGAIDGIRFRDHGFQLKAGDTLFVNTDGVSDAVNEGEEMFGVQRILEALNREPEASPSILVQTVKSTLDRFTGGVEQSDGMTMLAMRYYGTREATGSTLSAGPDGKTDALE